MTDPTIHELAHAAEAFLNAASAAHTTHPTTDVHGRGGVAGQAITPHCHWQCNVIGAHEHTRATFTETRRVLADLLQRVLEPAPSEVPFPQYRVQSRRTAAIASEPLVLADAIAALPLYQVNDRLNHHDYHLATRSTEDSEWEIVWMHQLKGLRASLGGGGHDGEV